jgi:hypothetical protein
MNVTDLLPQQRAQAVPCETCGAMLRHLLDHCMNSECLAASIDYDVRESRRIEAADDE